MTQNYNYSRKTMDELTRAGILLNAIRAPYTIFMRLCDEYAPEELTRGVSFWEELGLGEALQQRLSELISSNWADKEFDRVEKFNARFITAKDLDYPVKLENLRHPPIGLYVKGNANISFPSVAIVGTRNCSTYGQSVTINLAKSLARKNIIVISGGARGIDAASHRGCLLENGITVAVFGTGLDKVYPVEHKDLFSRILERGALISEYPMNTGGESWRFPERNRIIAAMSSKIIVTESTECGGAMITAKLARDLGREVWAVPGRINEEVCRGSNILLSEGAKVLYSIDEFIRQISGEHVQINITFDEIPGNVKANDTSPELSDNEKIVYSILQKQGGRTIDDLLIESGLDFVSLQDVLLELEAEGLIISSLGRYSAAV